jgi:hypothetical protein
MRLAVTMILCATGLTGCAVMNNQVKMDDLQKPSAPFLVDKTSPDSYPGFLAAEGNDLSCRYGIHHESAAEFSPQKAQVFAGLLAQALPSIVSHKVVLEQFDVYYNHRLTALHVLGSGGIGGVVGASIGDANDRAAHQNSSVFTVDKVLIDTDPEVNRHPGENQVGCDNRHEGEYYPSEISGGHDVIVTWMKFTVDARPYYFRSFYQFTPDGKGMVADGIKEALQMFVNGIAPKIKL